MEKELEALMDVLKSVGIVLESRFQHCSMLLLFEEQYGLDSAAG